MLIEYSLMSKLKSWKKYKDYLNENSIDDSGRSRYPMPRYANFTLK